MKKQFFALAAVAMIAGTVTFTSCAKEDTVAPVITVTGGNTITQNLPATSGQGTWTNPTVTATDDEDGEITAISVSGTVNPNLAGTYTLTYTCSDAAGNMATETVTVNIVNEAQFLNGEYNSDDTCQITPVAPYTNDVIVSTSVNNAITINNFGGFGNNVNVTGTVAANNTINIPTPQTLDATASLITVNATYTASPVTMTIIYTYQVVQQGTETCTSVMVL